MESVIFPPSSGGKNDTSQHLDNKKNRPPEGGRLGLACLPPRLEAPARHAGVEHGHGPVNDVGQLGVRCVEEQHEHRRQVQEVRGVRQDSDIHQAEQPGE